MTRRDLIYKWFVYCAGGLLPVWLVGAHILPRFPLFGVIPMLLPLTVAAVAVLEGGLAGAGFGLAVGLLWEVSTPGGLGLWVLGLSLAGLAIGVLTQYALSQSLPGCLLCSAGLLALIDSLRVFRGLITHAAPLSALLGVAVPEFLLSMLWSPVVYALFRRIYQRVGGTKLA